MDFDKVERREWTDEGYSEFWVRAKDFDALLEIYRESEKFGRVSIEVLREGIRLGHIVLPDERI